MSFEHLSTGPSTPWITTALADATVKQNRRLAALLAVVKNSGVGGAGDEFGESGGGAGGGGDGANGDEGNEGGQEGGFDLLDRQARFDKSFVEIQKLLEYAKSLDESTLSNDPSSPTTKRTPTTTRPTTSPAIIQKQTTPRDQLYTSQLSGAAGVVLPSRYGRKPIKQIEDELKKRIDLLKSNQNEWEAFQEKILQYQKSHLVQTNLIKQNREAAAAYFPESRLRNLASAHQDHERHRDQVLQKKKKIDKERLKKKMEAVQKKESAAEQGKRRETEANGKSLTAQKKWFILVSVAARIGYIQRTVEENRARNYKTIRENHAARIIQRAYRSYMFKKREQRKRDALRTISTVFHFYVLQRRMEAKYLAADKIRQFFKEVFDVSKLMKVVQKYRFSVLMAQRYVKSHLAIRSAQVTVLCKYWDKHESEWLAQRKMHGGGVGGSMASLDGGDKGGKAAAAAAAKSKKKVKKSKDEEKDKSGDKGGVVKILDASKIAAITEDLISRKKVFCGLLAAYRNQVAQELKKPVAKKALFTGIKAKPGGS
ncbi:hypothetical protein HDU98_009535 [Podochytrium sp. JEL0797]|nr:hypothetical protein HDU98_009535 [Podochytrium sp. JEL0797]